MESEPWSKWPDVWPDAEFEDIKVVDLGELFSQGQEPAACVLPGECRAPEVLFEDSFDHKTDLWLAGCAVRPSLDLIVQVATLTVLTSEDIHVGLSHVSFLGLWWL